MAIAKAFKRSKAHGIPDKSVFRVDQGCGGGTHFHFMFPAVVRDDCAYKHFNINLPFTFKLPTIQTIGNLSWVNATIVRGLCDEERRFVIFIPAFDGLSAKSFSIKGADAVYPSNRPRVTDENFKCLKLCSNR